MKWFFLIFVTAAAAGGWRYQDEIASMIPQPKPRSLPTRTVSTSETSPDTIHATGFVEGATETVELHFEIPGRLEILHVREGNRIQRGQVIASLASDILAQRVIQAEADLALAMTQRTRLVNAARLETRRVAQAKVMVAQAEVKRLEDNALRIRRLYDRGVSSDSEWNEAFYALETAKARLGEQQALAAEVEAPAREDDLEVASKQVAVASANLQHAKAMLNQTRLDSPIEGTILHVLKQPGEMVTDADPEPVLVMANLDTIRVRAYVEELHALNVSLGDSANVKADGLDKKTFSGKVVSCSPLMQQKQHRTHKPNEMLDVRTREIVIELEDASQLVVGLPVEVMITPAKPKENVLPSPTSESPTPITQVPVPAKQASFRITKPGPTVPQNPGTSTLVNGRSLTR
jgi:multidrug resistance efflux pump